MPQPAPDDARDDARATAPDDAVGTTPDDAAERSRDRPVSFVRRSGRMSDGQERAWAAHAGFYLIEVERGRAATSIRPGDPIDPAATYGRAAPLVVEIGGASPTRGVFLVDADVEDAATLTRRLDDWATAQAAALATITG